ncbi:MAG: hypothetical protein Q9169_001951 [Polycauliona sp. 2 TL-2023]
MSASTSKAASSLARYRPAILALTAIAAGLTIYTIQKNFSIIPPSKADPSQASNGSLHRSNAQRRRPTRQRSNAIGMGSQTVAIPELGVIVDYEARYHDGKRVFGSYYYANPANEETHIVWLAPYQLPSVEHLQVNWNMGLDEACRLRRHMEITFLDSFFAQEMPPEPPIPLSETAIAGFRMEFAAADQIDPLIVSSAIERYQMGNLQHHPARSTRPVDSDQPRPDQLSIPGTGQVLPATSGDLYEVFHIFHDATISEGPNGEDHLAETESIQSDGVEADEENHAPDNQNLMNLMFRIAEDQAKKEGFIHRGINCSSCNATPIRGIRWRCSNCADFDLCEQCHSLQNHFKTHIFYEIRIPAPIQSNPLKPAPVWYPGNPDNVCRSLTQELKLMLCTKTGINEKQVDAAWEQLQCLGSGDFEDDPYGFRIAINRRDFNKSFVPCTRHGYAPANLIYDRTFSFYDTNNDGLIGFEELLQGIACIANRGRKFHTKIFEAYDLDGDGFVDIDDFMKMFKGYFAMTKELMAQVISGLDDEEFDETDARNIIRSSQAISSIFSGPIPSGDPSLHGTEMPMGADGAVHVDDGQGFLIENDTTDRNSGPEVEIERDVIYQYTAQAMWELLNPMFKLRIDIALEADTTRNERRLYEHAIHGPMHDDINLSKIITSTLRQYEKQWYHTSRYAPPETTSFMDHFIEFVTRAISSAKDDLARPKEKAEEVQEPMARSTSAQASLTEADGGNSSPNYPGVASELHEGIITFDGAGSIEETTREKPLETLLADAGYSVASPTNQNSDMSPANSTSPPLSTKGGEQSYLDPTMPQHRPNSLEGWTIKHGQPEDNNHTIMEPKSLPPLSDVRIMTHLILTVLDEDDIRRGGPGRLNLEDFLNVMEGEKGKDLDFPGYYAALRRNGDYGDTSK